MTEVQDKNHKQRSGLPWMLLPIVLLALMFVGLCSLAAIAINDPGFAVERDYYKKAVTWDAARAEAAENVRLGWTIDVTVLAGAEQRDVELKAVIQTADGKPLRGANLEALAFANARANDILKLTFREVRPGEYRARVDKVRPGLWELRFSAQEGLSRFSEVVRLDFPSAKEGT
jgi:nitrogen fixation protein FixH